MSPIVFDTLLKAKYVDLSENKVSEKKMFSMINEDSSV